MSNVIASEDLSDEIVVNQFRDPLRSTAADSNAPLTDPQSGSRGSSANFILTAFPDRKDILYPHVIVSEAGDSSRRLDQRADVWVHSYDVAVQVLAKSATNMFQIRDSIKHWFEARTETFEDNGFTEPNVVSAGEPGWDDQRKVEEVQLVFNGTVYTSHTA